MGNKIAVILKAVVPFLTMATSAFITFHVLSYQRSVTENDLKATIEVASLDSFSSEGLAVFEGTGVAPKTESTPPSLDYSFIPASSYSYQYLTYEYEMPSLTIKKYTTNPVTVNVTRLMAAYDQEVVFPEWDYKQRFQTINFLWEFLVNQNDVDPTIAASILGSVCFEGEVGTQQKTYSVFKNIDDVRAKLTANTTDVGYGLVQWTTAGRCAWLLSFYEHVDSDLMFDWETKCVVAECCALLEELKKYNLFEDLSQPQNIEHATGKFACEFEVYGDWWEDWKVIDGSYVLKSGADSGKKRFEYAVHIYNHFMNQ